MHGIVPIAGKNAEKRLTANTEKMAPHVQSEVQIYALFAVNRILFIPAIKNTALTVRQSSIEKLINCKV